MKKLCRKANLPILTVAVGCVILILRALLYAVAVDVKNLLPWGHPLEITLWVVFAAAAVWIIASVWKLDGSNEYEDNFQPSALAAVGHYIAAAGILLTVLLSWYSAGRMIAVRKVLGILAAAGLILAGIAKQKGKPPVFLTHLAVCVFLVLHMLGNYNVWSSNPQLQDWVFDLFACVALVLFAFYEASFDAGMGRRRMQLGSGLLAVLCCVAALSGSGYIILYFGCAMWALTDLCALCPKPKRTENENEAA